MTLKPMITLRNIGIKNGAHQPWLLQNLDLTIQPEESVVIVGPSGIGKTVLLKIIAGLIKPDEGQVERQSQNMSMLFQKNALFDSLSVLENLLLPLKEKLHITGPEAIALARQSLINVQLSKNSSDTRVENLYPDELSGGMQKRLGIARALITRPEILIYDEPTAGLDPITSQVIAQLIQDLAHEQKTTTIAVTSEMNRAYQLADTIYLLDSDGWLKGGSPSEVQNTSDPRLRNFVYGLISYHDQNGEALS